MNSILSELQQFMERVCVFLSLSIDRYPLFYGFSCMFVDALFSLRSEMPLQHSSLRNSATQPKSFQSNAIPEVRNKDRMIIAVVAVVPFELIVVATLLRR